MVKVKICGITHTQDAVWAASLGVDFVGFNFVPGSPRKVSRELAKTITSQLPVFVTSVGVFANAELPVIERTLARVPLKAVQLHGEESPELCAALKAKGLTVIKTIPMDRPPHLNPLPPSGGRGEDEGGSQTRMNWEAWRQYIPVVDYFLLDHVTNDQLGGTGRPFSWELAHGSDSLGVPMFLAGGLSPDNVREAITQVRPFAVDVCSGVERTPRRKDFTKL
ncbi:MAG: phosphoribosylanthranilate isomerase, partial [Elusimicrobia bacterium]|nr:phosphoribosylanthranilate isomerase [Elusimicrobiota bacterium]